MRIPFQRRSGFTMMEILVVAAIVGIMAAMVLPRSVFSFVTPLRGMQRAVAEITELTMNGQSVRLRADMTEMRDRGPIVAEALTKVEDEFDPAKSSLEWTPLELVNKPEGEGWSFEPEILYFYSDGTCTPGLIRRADEDVRITEGELAMLTVTGFLFEPEEE